MHGRAHDGPGVSRQGGSGIGGGIAAGRRHAIPGGPQASSFRDAKAQALPCDGCGAPVRGVAVVVQRRLYCEGCAVVFAHPVPGLYFG
jgi:hypothetical protein